MKFDFQEIREWMNQDVSQMFHSRSFSINHLISLYPYLRRLYYLLFAAAFFMAFWALISLFFSQNLSQSYKPPLPSYSRNRALSHSGDERQALMQALSLAGVESRDPAWMEFRAFADCIGVNARPDLPKPLALWKWSHNGKTFEVAEGEAFYVNSESLTRSSFCKTSEASSGFRIAKAFHEQSHMVAEIEILKRDGDSFAVTEKFKLVRPLSSQSQDTSLSILKRMQVKWYGPDEFLMEHGSEEKDWKFYQRLEFGAGSRIEPVLLLPGQALIKQKQVMVAQDMGPLTQGLQIWVVEDVEQAGLRFRAWSLSGLYSETIVVPRQSEQWQPKVLQDQISLSAVRSSSQISIRILNQRWNIQLFDWMLHTANGWIKLTHPEQIDDYVSGKLVGELLIFHKVEHETDGWRAYFRLYSAAHSQKIDFSLKQQEIPISVEASPVSEPASERMPTEDYFVPVKKVENDASDQWDAGEVRAWEPPIAPHSMRRLLQTTSEKD